jgi:hypothetical protein
LIHATSRARSSSAGPAGGAGGWGAAAEFAAVTLGGDPPPSGGPGETGAPAGCAAEHAIEKTNHNDPNRPAQNDRSETLVPTYEEEYESPTLGNIPARFRSERPTAPALSERPTSAGVFDNETSRRDPKRVVHSIRFWRVSPPKKIAECRTYRMVSASGL